MMLFRSIGIAVVAFVFSTAIASAQQPAFRPVVSLFPTNGAPGTSVLVMAHGFAPWTPVEVGFGPPSSEYQVVQTGHADDRGRYHVRVRVPDSAVPGDRLVFVVADSTTVAKSPKAASDPFSVTRQEPASRDIGVYLVDVGNGSVGCGDALVPVRRPLLPNTSPLTLAIASLLSMSEPTVVHDGVTLRNALAQSNLQIDSIDVSNGVADIRLSGRFLSAGVCDDARILAQIEHTAYQFDHVTWVNVRFNGQTLAEMAQ